VRAELRFENIESAIDIFWPLMDDVVVGISLDEATWGCAGCRAHVSDEEPAIWLSDNFVRDRCECSTVALGELWIIWVGHIEIEAGVLSLEK
jgi:hypothetical protein